MKNQRISNVQAYHSLILQQVTEKRQHLVKNFLPKPTTKPKSRPAGSRTNQNQSTNAPVAVHRHSTANIKKLETRAIENVRQWGVRTKIDVDLVKELAAKLKSASTRTQKTIIRMPPKPTDSK